MPKCTESSGCVRSCLFNIRYTLSRLRCSYAVCMTVMLVTLAPPVAAQPLPEAQGFLGLMPGNEITVLVASLRRTDIAVDGQADVTTETSESIQIRYRVVGPERSGITLEL